MPGSEDAAAKPILNPPPSTLDAVMRAVAARPGTSVGVTCGVLKLVWATLCQQIENALLQRRGLVVPGFAHFALRHVSQEEGLWGVKTRLAPSVSLLPAFAAQHALVPQSTRQVHGGAPAQLVSLCGIVSEAGVAKDVVANSIKDIARRVGEVASAGHDLTVDCGVCKLSFSRRRFSVKWNQAFLNKLSDVGDRLNHPRLRCTSTPTPGVGEVYEAPSTRLGPEFVPDADEIAQHRKSRPTRPPKRVAAESPAARVTSEAGREDLAAIRELRAGLQAAVRRSEPATAQDSQQQSAPAVPRPPVRPHSARPSRPPSELPAAPPPPRRCITPRPPPSPAGSAAATPRPVERPQPPAVGFASPSPARGGSERSPRAGELLLSESEPPLNVRAAPASLSTYQQKRRLKLWWRRQRSRAFSDAWAAQLKSQRAKRDVDKARDERQATDLRKWIAAEEERDHAAKAQLREHALKVTELNHELAAQRKRYARGPVARMSEIGSVSSAAVFGGQAAMQPVAPDAAFLRQQIEDKRVREELEREADRKETDELNRRILANWEKMEEEERKARQTLQTRLRRDYRQQQRRLRRRQEKADDARRSRAVLAPTQPSGDFFLSDLTHGELMKQVEAERREEKARAQQTLAANRAMLAEQQKRRKEEQEANREEGRHCFALMQQSLYRTQQRDIERKRRDARKLSRMWSRQVSHKQAADRAQRAMDRSWVDASIWKNESSSEGDRAGPDDLP